MTGDELIELIEKNGWEDTDLFMSINGKIGKVETAEAMFPRLLNTNDVILTDGNDFEQDEEFWRTYYGTYMDIISEEEADEEFHKGNPSFYILYCDGTEGMIQDMTEEEWQDLKESGVMFGYEIGEKNIAEKVQEPEEKLVEGHTYRFGDCDWVVAEIKVNCAVLQSCGVTSGKWPGYVMPEFGGDGWYDQNIDGKNISSYDVTMSKLYAYIKDAEYVSADYGKGLYLISSKKYEGSENYRYAIRLACEDYARFGAACIRAWLGTVYDSHNACFAVTKHVFQDPQYNRYVIAPAFNLDVSKITLFGDEIVIDA